MFFALVIRLYWLRQTADYDFDFPVQTSVREMSILLLAVETIIRGLDIVEDSDVKVQDYDSSDDAEEFPINNQSQVDSVEDVVTVNFYRVGYEFPIDVDGDAALFMTAVHLDAGFDRQKVIYALQYSSSISDKETHFTYDPGWAIPSGLCARLDDEGRWTLWFSSSDELGHLYSETDLTTACKEFFNDLALSFYSFHGEVLTMNIVASYPIFVKDPMDTFSTKSLYGLQNALSAREAMLEYVFSRRVAKLVQTDLQSKKGRLSLVVGDIELKINVQIGGRNPISEMLSIMNFIDTETHEAEEQQPRLAIFNVLIIGDVEEAEPLRRTLQLVQSAVLKDIIDKSELVVGSGYAIVLAEELDNFINGRRSSIQLEFSNFLNNIAYNLIDEREEFVGSRTLLDAALLIPECGPMAHATLGFWYFRNPVLDPVTAYETGIEKYEHALSLGEKISFEYQQEMYQKYYYERARCALHTVHNLGVAE